MGFRHISVLAVVGLLLSTLAFRSYAQSTDLRTWLDEQGSVPPVHQWFGCLRQLERKPRDKRKAQECLDSLLSHPEIEKGRISFKRYKHEDLLTFHLQSPKLIVSDVELGVAAGDLAKLHELLVVNGNALRQGEPYERLREGSSWVVLDMLLRSQGRRAGVTRTLHMDYDKKTAQVAYKIWEGPPGEPERLVPPYAEPCPILNANFNGFDWDDFTPVGYVRQQMKTKWLGCFSEADLRDDEDRLKRMTFLKESKISVSGSGDSRDFGFHFRSSPIPVAKVVVNGYGLLGGLSEADIPALAIHAGDIYSQSRVGDQEKSLEGSYQRPDWQLKVFTDVQITPDGEAVLIFSLLAYPDDTVYVNDKAYNVTHYREE
jgi:hypothetical protein